MSDVSVVDGETLGHPTRRGRPSRFQLWLAAVNVLFPVGLLGWALLYGHAVFYSLPNLGAMGVLVVLALDTWYQYWIGAASADVRLTAGAEDEQL